MVVQIMNLSEKYAYEIFKERSFSKAAKSMTFLHSDSWRLKKMEPD